MKKFSYVILLVVVAVLALAIGFSLAGNTEKNKITDSDAVSTTSATTNESVLTTTESAIPSSSAVSTEARPTLPEVITPQEAKNIALTAAGFDSADVWDKEVEPDYENGRWFYEVSFEKNGTDYEYIIDAKSGEILHSEVDTY